MISRIKTWWYQWQGGSVQWQRIGRNFSLSLFGAFVGLFIGLAQTALLVKNLSIAEYGRLLIVLNLFPFLSMFAGIRVNDVLYQLYPQFRQRQDEHAVRDLLWLCLGLSLLVGLLIGGGVFLAAGWIARTFYDASLTPMFRIFALTVLLTAFTGVYETILRLHDRFASVIVPNILSSLVVFVGLLIYFLTRTSYSLAHVIAIVSLGVVVRCLPPLAQSLWLERRHLWLRSGRFLAALGPYRAGVKDVLFNANLAGYLKLAFSPGDLFFLGLFGAPEQVAIYGLATQLLRPLILVQDNIQIALMPEVTSLWAQGETGALRDLSRRYVRLTFWGGAVLVALAAWLARPALLWLAKPEYLTALPIFYLMLITTWLTVTFVIFYPLGLSMGMLKWFNLANAVNVLVLAGAILLGPLTALRMAWLQLLATLIRRVSANWLVWSRLERAAAPTLALEGGYDQV